jgi:hypothetical protein
VKRPCDNFLVCRGPLEHFSSHLKRPFRPFSRVQRPFYHFLVSKGPFYNFHRVKSPFYNFLVCRGPLDDFSSRVQRPFLPFHYLWAKINTFALTRDDRFGWFPLLIIPAAQQFVLERRGRRNFGPREASNDRSITHKVHFENRWSFHWEKHYLRVTSSPHKNPDPILRLRFMYNASVVNFYNAKGSLARFENINILSYILWKTL